MTHSRTAAEVLCVNFHAESVYCGILTSDVCSVEQCDRKRDGEEDKDTRYDPFHDIGDSEFAEFLKAFADPTILRSSLR